MKTKLITITGSITLILLSCQNKNEHQNDFDKKSYDGEIEQSKNIEEEKKVSRNIDTTKINQLINTLYDWSLLNENDIVLFPFLQQDSLYVGINFSELNSNVTIMERKNIFTSDFINNYKKIYNEIDSRLKSEENKYLTTDLPPFFSNASPWCNCQDYTEDNQSFVEMIDYKIELIDDTIHYSWQWKRWESPAYLIKIVPQNNEYRITYMQGFTFENCFR